MRADRRTRRVAVVMAAALVALSTVGATVRPVWASPAVATFDSSPRGYIGCVESYEPELYCVVATTGADSASATVRVFSVEDRVPWLVDADETATFDASVLAVSGTGAQTAMTLNAQMPRLGSVNLTIYTQGAMVDTSENDTCPVYPLHFEATSPSVNINPVWRVTGDIAGEKVFEYGTTCTDAFTGPTSATWRVVGAA